MTNKWIAETRAVELRAIVGSDNSFEGIACRYGVEDSYGTTFVAGCFTRGGLDKGSYSLLWMHDPNRPVGTFTAVDAPGGLYIVGKWDDTAAGRDARMAAMSGSAGDLSVGFTWYQEPGQDEDMITIARLQEVSQVTSRFGAVPGSVLTAVRNAVEAMEDRWTTEYPNKEEAAVTKDIEQGTPEAEQEEVQAPQLEETIEEVLEETVEERAELGELAEGDFVSFVSEDGTEYGRVEYIMTEGTFGVEGDALSFLASEENPFALIRLYDKEDGNYEATSTFVGKSFAELTKIELVGDVTDEETPREENNDDRASRMTLLSRYIQTLF
jgi:HK97 family phage prohead protease